MTDPKVPAQHQDSAWEYRAGYRAGRVHGSDAINPVTIDDDTEDADLARADAWDAGCRVGRKEKERPGTCVNPGCTERALHYSLWCAVHEVAAEPSGNPGLFDVVTP